MSKARRPNHPSAGPYCDAVKVAQAWVSEGLSSLQHSSALVVAEHLKTLRLKDFASEDEFLESAQKAVKTGFDHLSSEITRICLQCYEMLHASGNKRQDFDSISLMIQRIFEECFRQALSLPELDLQHVKLAEKIHLVGDRITAEPPMSTFSFVDQWVNEIRSIELRSWEGGALFLTKEQCVRTVLVLEKDLARQLSFALRQKQRESLLSESRPRQDSGRRARKRITVLREAQQRRFTIIAAAITKGLKGSVYAQELDKNGLRPPDTWVHCPKTYSGAYRDTHYRHQVQREKSRVSAKLSSRKQSSN